MSNQSHQVVRSENILVVELDREKKESRHQDYASTHILHYESRPGQIRRYMNTPRSTLYGGIVGNRDPEKRVYR